MSDYIKNNLTLIIVSFNSGKVILKTLSGLINSSICSVIIVDNASIDGSQELLKEKFPQVDLIRLQKNMGYGCAANVAFKKINTEYGLLLNPDVLLSESLLKNVFSRVMSFDDDIAICSPALKSDDFYKKGDVVVNYLIGAFLLIRASALKEIGYFDENIFLFYEEKDLELRLINKGYKLLLQSDIFVEHLKSSSTKSSEKIIFLRNWHVAWSKLYYSYKHNILNNRLEGYLLVAKYFMKFLINRSHKRIKYKARYRGALSYLKKESAFSDSGGGRYADII